MAKTELSGTVTSFRQSKFKQDSHQTIVHMASKEDAGKVMELGWCGFARTALAFRAGSWPATVRRRRFVCGGRAGFRRRPWALESRFSVDAIIPPRDMCAPLLACGPVKW